MIRATIEYNKIKEIRETDDSPIIKRKISPVVLHREYDDIVSENVNKHVRRFVHEL